jgi:hypothetical protein
MAVRDTTPHDGWVKNVTEEACEKPRFKRCSRAEEYQLKRE